MLLVPPAPPQLATLPDYPSLGASLVYQLNGLLVVFIALGAIWALMEMIGRLFRHARKAAVSVPRPQPASVSPSPIDGEPHGAVVAAIVAAVATEIEGPHRITAIVPVEFTGDWAREGRREIFASHKTR